MSSRPSILVTGATGGLASILVDMLAKKYELIGADHREMPLIPASEKKKTSDSSQGKQRFPGTFYKVDYTHRKMAEVFRKHSFSALLHLGRIRTTWDYTHSERYNINVLGTRNLLNLARKHGVKNVIVFSTFHVYGAHPHNPLYITEDEPLRASQTFPELLDAVELDNFAKTFSLQYPEVRTVILRPVNVIGARIYNEISRVLRSPLCPTLMGYNPMLQFIHERDIAKALKLCLESDRSGVYNVVGEGMLPYSKAIEIVGSTPLPIPPMVAYSVVGTFQKFGLRFPKHLMDYFKYSTIVSDQLFRKDFGFVPDVTSVEALKSIRLEGQSQGCSHLAEA